MLKAVVCGPQIYSRISPTLAKWWVCQTGGNDTILYILQMANSFSSIRRVISLYPEENRQLQEMLKYNNSVRETEKCKSKEIK